MSPLLCPFLQRHNRRASTSPCALAGCTVLLLLTTNTFSFRMVALPPSGNARTPPRCRDHRCHPRCHRYQTSRQSAAACGRCSTLRPGSTLFLKSALKSLCCTPCNTLPLLLKGEALAVLRCSCNAMTASKLFTAQKLTLGLLLAHILVVHSVVSPAHPLHAP